MIISVKNILVNYLENRAQYEKDINFDIKNTAGNTFIRFTTPSLEDFLQPTYDKKGAWKKGYYAFYEISNRKNKVNISCVLTQEDLTPEQIEKCHELIEKVGNKVNSDWEYHRVKTWKVYDYTVDDEISEVEANIISSLNNIIDNKIPDFEKLL